MPGTRTIINPRSGRDPFAQDVTLPDAVCLQINIWEDL